MRPRLPLDRVTWTRWRNAIGSFARSAAGGRAKALFAALLVLLLAISAMNVVNSYVGRDFMTSIEQRDTRGLRVDGAALRGGVRGLHAARGLFRFCEERLGLLWRQWLTRALVLDYLGHRHPYRLREQGEIDNPDQRIADDVRTFTTTTLSFVLMVLNTITIIAFSGVLWSISPCCSRPRSPTRRSARCRDAARTAADRAHLHQSDREASFRADLVHVRANAESVALLRREGRLRTRLLRRVDALTANTRRMIAVNRNLSFFTTGYNYLIQIIPALIVGPLFMRGAGRVRRDHAVGDGVLAPDRRVLADRDAVPVDLVVRGRAHAARSLSEGMRPRGPASPIEIVGAGRRCSPASTLTLRSPRRRRAC